MKVSLKFYALTPKSPPILRFAVAGLAGVNEDWTRSSREKPAFGKLVTADVPAKWAVWGVLRFTAR